MNIPVEVLIGYGGSAVTIIGGWFAMKYGQDRANEKIVELERQNNASWAWKEKHEAEAASLREKFNNELAGLKAGNLVINKQYEHIIDTLNDIKDRISSLEKKSDV